MNELDGIEDWSAWLATNVQRYTLINIDNNVLLYTIWSNKQRGKKSIHIIKRVRENEKNKRTHKITSKNTLEYIKSCYDFSSHFSILSEYRREKSVWYGFFLLNWASSKIKKKKGAHNKYPYILITRQKW